MKTFEEAWEEKKKQGYQYGGDALENVHFGWKIAEHHFSAEVARLTSALEWFANLVPPIRLPHDEIPASQVQLKARAFLLGMPANDPAAVDLAWAEREKSKER